MPTVAVDVAVSPTTHAEDLSSLISDSTGVTKYRVDTKVWDIYSNIEKPYWHFPEGAYLERYDSVFNVEFFIKADTVYYYEKEELWKMIGNVVAQNEKGVKFETSELYMNQKESPSSMNFFYTDKFARIDEGGDRISTGTGLRSNQNMTRYSFYEYGLEATITESTDSIISTDSIKAP